MCKPLNSTGPELLTHKTVQKYTNIAFNVYVCTPYMFSIHFCVHINTGWGENGIVYNTKAIY